MFKRALKLLALLFLLWQGTAYAFEPISMTAALAALTAAAGTAGVGYGAGNIFGLWGGKGKKGKPPTAEVLYAEDYPWMRQAYEALAGYGMGEVERSRAGQPPQWWEGLRPQVTEQALQALRQAYMGIPGLGPGILGIQTAYDVARNLGRGGAATRAYGTQLDQWGQKARDIGTYIAGLTGQYSQRASEFFPTFVAGLPQGQQVAGVPQFPGTAPQAPDWQTMLSGWLQMLPWGAGSMKPPTGVPAPATPDYTAPYSYMGAPGFGTTSMPASARAALTPNYLYGSQDQQNAYLNAMRQFTPAYQTGLSTQEYLRQPAPSWLQRPAATIADIQGFPYRISEGVSNYLQGLFR